MQLFLLIIIIILAIYIVYLHFQIEKKNILINSIVRKISGNEKQLSADELKKFISELHRYNPQAVNVQDKLFDEKILDFIFGNAENTRVYIHYTMDENIARAIMSEGFKFNETFHNTALPVSNDKLDLLFVHNNRKYFGDLIVVINISKELINRSIEVMNEAGLKNYSVENILSEIPSKQNDAVDSFFLLPAQYIKGVINYKTGVIISNAVFQPDYQSPGFLEKIKSLTGNMNQNQYFR